MGRHFCYLDAPRVQTNLFHNVFDNVQIEDRLFHLAFFHNVLLVAAALHGESPHRLQTVGVKVQRSTPLVLGLANRHEQCSKLSGVVGLLAFYRSEQR